MQRGVVLAIDLAKQTGLAEGRPGDRPRLSSLWFGDVGNDQHVFYANLTAWMAIKLRDSPPDFIAIEEPVPPSAAFGHTSHDTTMVTIGGFAIIVGIIVCKRIPYQTVRISTWRKHFLGNGRLPTKEAKAAALARCRVLGWDAPDHNAAEAAGIWDWAGATFMGALPQKLHLFGETGKGVSK
jgi:hypothetical protein